MGSGLSDPIFALFVVVMVLLFFLLLLKRLYRKPSPMELQFESIVPPRQSNTGQHGASIPTISVAVHHHGNHHQTRSNQGDTVTPPPSFEDVVSQKPPQNHVMSMTSHDNVSFVDDQIPPPSYQEYLNNLNVQKEGYRENEQGKF